MKDLTFNVPVANRWRFIGFGCATSMDAQFEKATFVFCWAYRLRNNLPVIRHLLRCDMSVGVWLFGSSCCLSIFFVLGFSCCFILSFVQARYAGFIQKISSKNKARKIRIFNESIGLGLPLSIGSPAFVNKDVERLCVLPWPLGRRWTLSDYAFQANSTYMSV